MSDIDEIGGIDENVTVVQRSDTVFNEEIQRRFAHNRSHRGIRTSLSDDDDDEAGNISDVKIETISISKFTDEDRAAAANIEFSRGKTDLSSLYPGFKEKREEANNEHENTENSDEEDDESIDLPDDTPDEQNTPAPSSSSYFLRKLLIRGSVETGSDAELWNSISTYFNAIWMRVDKEQAKHCWMKIPKEKYLSLIVDKGEEEGVGEFLVTTDEGCKVLVCPR